MLKGKDYSKETQVLARKPSEKCGKRLELLQSPIKFLSPVFPAGPEHLSLRVPLFTSFPSLHVTSTRAQVPPQETEGTAQPLSPGGKEKFHSKASC